MSELTTFGAPAEQAVSMGVHVTGPVPCLCRESSCTSAETGQAGRVSKGARVLVVLSGQSAAASELEEGSGWCDRDP